MLKNVRESIIVLVVVIVLLFVCASINTFTPQQIQAVQFTLTLLGIFVGAHYEFRRFDRHLREERRKELRQQRLKILDHVEMWLRDVEATLESIEVMRQFGVRDTSDGKLIVEPERLMPLSEKLLLLDKGGHLAVAKAVDIGDKELAGKVGVIWLLLDAIRDVISKKRLPGIDAIGTSLVEAQRAVDRARLES